ncbi:MAG: O-antigen polysaccharide polymerase Wzy, partial [Clostridia bacterium]|nr:O-antigen polysaccharide polymerase Wzy [Clostridia bacterium]
MLRLKSMPLKVIYSLLLLILSLASVIFDLGLWANGVLLLIVYGVAIYSWLKVTHKPTSLYFMFLMYCFLSNGAQTLLYTMGVSFDKFPNIYERFHGVWINRMISFQILAIAFLAIGAMMSYKPDRIEPQREEVVKKDKTHKTGIVLDIADICYLILLTVMVVLYVSKFFTRTSMNYHDYFYGETSGTGVDTRITLLFYAFLYTSYYNHVNDGFRKFIYVTTVILAFLMLSVGSRGLTIPLIFGLLFVRALTSRGLPRMSWKTVLKWVLLAIALLYVMQAFKTLRGYSISEWNGEVLFEAFGTGVWDGLVNIFAEMGSSAQCVIVTITEVDKSHVGQEYTIFYALCKMFVPIDIANALDINTSLMLPYESLSYWVTAAGDGMDGTAMWGYSIIAEMYFNFGKLGFWGMFGFGFIWVRLEAFVKWLISKGHKVAAMAVVYLLSYSIFLARAETTLIVTYGRWAFYILLVSVFMVEILHTRISMSVKIR